MPVRGIPAWLVERPIAHRGLHDARYDVPENTLAAFEAAIIGGYAIELDLNLSADGRAMMFHDGTLDRLTQFEGPLASRTAVERRMRGSWAPENISRRSAKPSG